jgi:hypothetical protein
MGLQALRLESAEVIRINAAPTEPADDAETARSTFLHRRIPCLSVHFQDQFVPAP